MVWSLLSLTVKYIRTERMRLYVISTNHLDTNTNNKKDERFQSLRIQNNAASLLMKLESSG